jgi:hypothetical protein
VNDAYDFSLSTTAKAAKRKTELRMPRKKKKIIVEGVVAKEEEKMIRKVRRNRTV